MPPRRPGRIRGFDYLGLYVYFVTICTWSRAPRFTDEQTVSETLAHFQHSAERHHFAIVAYCFMPDHLHLLLDGQDDGSDLRASVVLGKQRSGFDFCRRVGGRLWQGSYHDRVLRQEEDTLSVARYILENPVRAGLVRAPADYAFVGSDVHSLAAILASVG